MVVRGVERVEGGHLFVLGVEADEPLLELIALPERLGVVVRLKLAAAREDVDAKGDDRVDRGDDVGEEHKGDDERGSGARSERAAKAKAREERRDVAQERKAAELDKHERGAGDEEPDGVRVLPVPKLVGEDGDDQLVVLLALVEERVVQDDPLVLPKTKQVCVAVAGALGRVHDKELLQRKLDRAREPFNLRLQIALLERVVLVEERRDEEGVNRDEEELQRNVKCEEVNREKRSAHAVDDDCEPRERRRKHENEQHLLHIVHSPRPHCHLVESVLLLKDKVAVEADGDVGQGEDDEEEQRKGNRLHRFAAVPRAFAQIAGNLPHPRKHVPRHQRQILGESPESNEAAEVPLVEVV
mmetsp:Transcript_10500/g.34497  ORF Transcript_10500/g.34497 Transcript_10500/m.34497 type:complete len:357 (+) Transcript_10500:1245-2315(+)